MINRLLMVAGGGATFHPVSPDDINVSNLMSSWWCIPKAVEMGGRIYFSGVRDTGANLVYSIDLDDPSDIDTFTLMTNEPDDHNAAALLIPTDKPPLVFYARHNQDGLMRYRKGTTIGDITSLGAQSTISLSGNTTYSQLWRLPGTDEVHIWTREEVSGDPRYWRNAFSTNYATSWSTPRRVFDFGSGQQGYIGTVPTAADPTILRVALTGHPTVSTIHDIYYCEVDMVTGEITNQAGTSLGNLKTNTSLPVLVTTECDKIVDTDTAGGHNARLFDIGDGPDPEVVWGDWTNNDNMVYNHTFYNGSVWTPSAVVAAGESFGYIETIHYNGGIIFLRDTPGDVVYLSREDAGTWYIEKWENSGGWSMTEEVVTGSQKFVRPFPVVGPVDGPPVVYHDVQTYPRTATGSLDWAADFVVPAP